MYVYILFMGVKIDMNFPEGNFESCNLWLLYDYVTDPKELLMICILFRSVFILGFLL